MAMIFVLNALRTIVNRIFVVTGTRFFYQRIYKRTGSKYLSWLRANRESVVTSRDNIYFYGHSLAITDGDIIANLILQDNTNTTIYFHDKKALGSQISNLVKIIGEEELIKRTGSSNPSIKFLPCS